MSSIYPAIPEISGAPALAIEVEPVAVIAGFPCSATYLTADIARDLISREFGDCEVLQVNDLAGWQKVAKTSSDRKMLFLTEQPDEDFCAALGNCAVPIIITGYGFSDACRDFMSARQAAMLDTTRTLARGSIHLHGLKKLGRAIKVHFDDSTRTANIAEGLSSNLGVNPDICKAVVAERRFERAVSDVLEEVFPHPRIQVTEKSEAAFLENIGSIYGASGVKDDGPLDIPIEALLGAAPPHAPLNATIDLTGPARCLTIGPYLYLPRGRWTLDCVFTTDGNASKNSLVFDLTADGEVKFSEKLDFESTGKFRFSASFEILDSLHPFEFRTFLSAGALEGNLTLLSLHLNWMT